VSSCAFGRAVPRSPPASRVPRRGWAAGGRRRWPSGRCAT
jgi:hypothetical protein